MEHLQCTTKTTDHYETAKRTGHTFASLCMPVIRQVNKFVDENIMQEGGSPLVLCVKNSEERSGLSGDSMTTV